MLWLSSVRRASPQFGQYRIILLAGMADVCEQRTQDDYVKVEWWPGVGCKLSGLRVGCPNHYSGFVRTN